MMKGPEMSIKNASQSQQNPETPKAEASPDRKADPWTDLVHETLDRMVAVSDVAGKIQKDGLERTRTIVEDSAQIMLDTLAYTNRLRDEWRSFAVDATRSAVGSINTNR